MGACAIFYNSGTGSTIDYVSTAVAHLAQMKAEQNGHSVTFYNTYGKNEGAITTLIDTITIGTLSECYVCCQTASSHSTSVMTYDQVAYLDSKMLTAKKGTVVNSGTCGSNSTATEIVLGSTASTVNDTYNGMFVKTAGSSSLYRYISDYVGSTKAGTITDTTTPITTTSTYIVYTNTYLYVIGDAVTNETAMRYAFRTLWPNKQIPLICNLLGGYGTGFEQSVITTRTSGGGSHNTTTLSDTSYFTADALVGYYVGIESATAGTGQVRIITANTADALTVSPAWTTPTGTVVYTVSLSKDFVMAHKYLPFALRTYLAPVTSDVHAIWCKMIDKYGTLSKPTPTLIGDLELLKYYCQVGKIIFDADTLSVV